MMMMFETILLNPDMNSRLLYLTSLKPSTATCFTTPNRHSYVDFLYKCTLIVHGIADFLLHILLDCICQLLPRQHPPH
jgi:hypothetical protein